MHPAGLLRARVNNREDATPSLTTAGRRARPRPPRRAFTAKLRKKNGQLNVADHERILLVVNWVLFVDADDVIRVLSQQNPDDIPNIDRIIFEARPGEFSVVFDRRVIEAEKSGQLPSTNCS